MALPALLGLAGAASIRPSALQGALAAPRPGVVLALGFVAWAAITALWAPGRGLELAGKLLALTVFGALFVLAAGADAGMRRMTTSAVSAACAVLIILLGVEATLDMPLTRLTASDLPDWEVAKIPGRGGTVLAAILWAGAGGLLLRPTLVRGAAALVLLAAGAFAGGQFFHTANNLALMAGVAAFVVGWMAPATAIRLVTAALALWLAAAPLSYPLIFSNADLNAALPFSWSARIEAWNYVAAGVLEQPWFGHGLEAARADNATTILRGIETDIIPTHPHSASLQIWFETGLVGAGLAAAALTLGGQALARACRGKRAAGAATTASFVALGIIANLSYSLWQEWWDAAMFISAAACAALMRMETPLMAAAPKRKQSA